MDSTTMKVSDVDFQSSSPEIKTVLKNIKTYEESHKKVVTSSGKLFNNTIYEILESASVLQKALDKQLKSKLLKSSIFG